MKKEVKSKVIVVCGPTATGKSDLAVYIAKYMKSDLGKEAEIISADSRQVYKYLDIGTGKITESEMQGVPHHLLDVMDPNENFSVIEFKEQADRAIFDILKRGKIPILCGGTGLYIDTVIHDIKLPEATPDQELRNELEKLSLEEVLEIFYSLNADKENLDSKEPIGNRQQPHHVDLKNKRRVIRAIEILKVYGYIPETKTNDRFDVLTIAVDAPDQVLKDRIAKRLEKRMAEGMVKESKDLIAKNILTHERMQKLGLEYAHIADLLDQKLTPQEFTIRLNFAIWHYAKRQRTWFKRNPNAHWVDSDSIIKSRKKIEDLVKKFVC